MQQPRWASTCGIDQDKQTDNIVTFLESQSPMPPGQPSSVHSKAGQFPVDPQLMMQRHIEAHMQPVYQQMQQMQLMMQ
eukprot:3089106-Pyramimonas_sp.AAC.1